MELGVAAAVIQFADFGTRLLSSAWEVYHDASGEGTDLKDFNIIAKDLNRCISPIRGILKTSAPKRGRQENATSQAQMLDSELRPLCSTCDEIARDLEKVLPKTFRTIKSNVNAERSSSSAYSQTSVGARFFLALEQHWNREKISRLKDKLKEVREGIISVLLTSVWLTARELPDKIEAFNQKQDEVMLGLHKHLEERQHLGPVITDSANPDLTYDPAATPLQGTLTKTDFGSSILRELFDPARPPKEFTFDSFSGHANFDPEFAAAHIRLCVNFEDSDYRETSISDPYAHTYNWALGRPPCSITGEPKWSDFPRWLQSTSPEESARPFWIAGKPGSGKSTMLKFLANHEETRGLLQTWAGDHSLEVLTYYAWSPGSDLLKSTDGLLRTFLSQLLSKHPHLTPIICPQYWEYSFYARNLLAIPYTPAPTWALRESFDKFLNLDKSVLKYKVAVFIDGLDEFQEAPEAFCDLVEKLASHPLVKICVASREWAEFKHAFQDSPTIRMHDLTEGAMRKYLSGRFREPAILPRVERYQSRFDKMMDNILLNASGVFLWVTLVTNIITRKVAAHEPLARIEKALEEMPPEMEQLYDVILDSIPEELQQSTAWTLLFYQNRIAHIDTSSHVFYLADESRGTMLPESFEDIDGRVILHEVDDRLSFRTRGILHQVGGSLDEIGYPRASINAVHRTAAEWLDQTPVIEKLKASAGTVQLHASYFWALLYLLKRHVQLESEQDCIVATHPIGGFVAHAACAEHQEIETSILAQTMEAVFKGPSTRRLETSPTLTFVLASSLMCPMLSYVEPSFKMLERHYGLDRATILNGLGTLLQVFPESEFKSSRGTVCSSQHIEVLRMLLYEGATQITAEQYVETLFKVARTDGSVTRESFDEVLKQHFGSKRKIFRVKTRGLVRRLGILK